VFSITYCIDIFFINNVSAINKKFKEYDRFVLRKNGKVVAY